MGLSEKLHILLQHYNALPEAPSGVPFRHDLNPAQFKDIISWCMIAVSHSARDMQVTLCGTSVEKILGIQLQGINMFDAYPEQDKDKYEQVFKLMLSQPCGLKLDRIFNSRVVGDKHVTMIGLPLANKDGVTDRMVVVVDIPEVPKANIMMALGENTDLSLKETLSYKVLDIGHGLPESDLVQPVLLSEL